MSCTCDMWSYLIGLTEFGSCNVPVHGSQVSRDYRAEDEPQEGCCIDHTEELDLGPAPLATARIPDRSNTARTTYSLSRCQII